MRLPARQCARRGATIVESAAVYSITMLLMIGAMVGGLGIFRYQEVAELAREGARFASTHGGQYNADGWPATTGVSAISSSSDMQTYLSSQTLVLDASKLTVTASWTPPANTTPTNMPTYDDTTSTIPGQSQIQNYVIVTVTYTWVPEAFLVGPFTLSSTSKMAMCY
jgi:Flp pilus assembly protein TadG